MFHLEIKVANSWDVWPYTFRSLKDAIRDARKILNYMPGKVCMRIIHSLDGAEAWELCRP